MRILKYIRAHVSWRDIMPHNEPLGLPKGSIRAIIALMFVIAVLSWGAAEATYGPAVPNELWTLLGVIITHYFTTRGKEK